MAYSLFGGFISNRNIPGVFRIREPLDRYKTRGVFQQEHPSCFMSPPSKGWRLIPPFYKCGQDCIPPFSKGGWGDKGGFERH